MANNNGSPLSNPVILYLTVLLPNNEEGDAESRIAFLADAYQRGSLDPYQPT